MSEPAHAVRSSAGVCKAAEYSDEMPPPAPKRVHDVGRIGITAHIERVPEFKHRFNHYNCDVTFIELRNARMSYWQVEDRTTGARQGTSFDSEMDKLLTLLAQGHKLEHIDLIPHTASAAVVTSTDGKGPHCAVCDCVGGLPCPAMLKSAIKYGLRLALTPDAMAKNSFHVHPGRCRKRLRQLLNVAEAKT